MGKNPASTRSPFKTMYKGTTHNLKKDKMHRPEGAGNFDNMDDVNIVESISLNQGTVEHTPANDSDIANKKYVDDNAGGTGSMTTVKEGGTQLGGADIVTLDFDGDDFDLTESPDTEVNIVINDAGIDHDATTNFVANEHIDHTSVTLTAGVGLSGGGDISSNRTFTVDLNELGNETTIAAGDFIAMIDITDSGSQKITFANIESTLNHDSLAGFVTAEHVDWAGASAGTIHITNFAALQNTVEDTTPELGGEMDAGAHTIGFTQQSQTGDGTTTIDWKLGNKDFHTFGAQNETFVFTAPTNPCNILLVLKQDATGSRTATWPAAVLWPGGTAPTLTTAASSVDIIAFYFDGTNYFGESSLNFS